MSYGSAVRTRLDAEWGIDPFAPTGAPWSHYSLDTMRDRSRRLERENPIASALLDRSVENVIGTGISIRPTTSSKEFNAEIADKWAKWTSGVFADVRREHSFPELQRLAYRAMKRDGDCGFVLIDQGFGPELQLIEGHLLSSPPGNRRRIVSGIELNRFNRAVAYWIKGEDTNGQPSHTAVDARDFAFLASRNRYGMARGETQFNGTFGFFDQIHGWTEAVVVAARIAASQALIVRKKGAQNELAQGLKTRDAMGVERPAKAIEAGMINYLEGGDDMTAFNPTQPGANFVEGIRLFCRILGVKFGLTVERVLLDFSQANYSVSRSTALQEMRAAEPEQEQFYAKFLARIYPWFVSKTVSAGEVTTPPPEDMWAHDWIPQGRPLVEPAKEAMGLAKLVELGIETPEWLATERGYDWNKLMPTLKKNIDEMREAGLKVAWAADEKAELSVFSNALVEDDDADNN